MSVTAQQVINRIDGVFDDSGNGRWTAGRKLEFVNAAIDAAWAFGIKDKKVDTSITLASGTIEYTPTATPELEDGFALCYVEPLNPDDHRVRLHRVWQKLNGTTWTIVFPADTAIRYNGKDVQLYYNSRIARVATATDSIELPMDYLWNYATYIAFSAAIISGANFNARPFEQLIGQWYTNAQRAALAYQRGFTVKLPTQYEGGRAVSLDPNAGYYRV